MTQIRLVIGILILFTITSITACSKSQSGSIMVVKNGTTEFDRNTTVGQVFENYKYFKKVKWSSSKNNDGTEIVEVVGTLDFDKVPDGKYYQGKGALEDLVYKFLVYKDNTFKFYSFHSRGNDKNGKEVVQEEIILNNTPAEDALFINHLLGSIYKNNSLFTKTSSSEE